MKDRPEGGESFEDVGVRCEDFLDEVIEKFLTGKKGGSEAAIKAGGTEKILLVSHGGWINSFRKTLNLTFLGKNLRVTKINNCSFSLYNIAWNGEIYDF